MSALLPAMMYGSLRDASPFAHSLCIISTTPKTYGLSTTTTTMTQARARAGAPPLFWCSCASRDSGLLVVASCYEPPGDDTQEMAARRREAGDGNPSAQRAANEAHHHPAEPSAARTRRIALEARAVCVSRRRVSVRAGVGGVRLTPKREGVTRLSASRAPAEVASMHSRLMRGCGVGVNLAFS